MSRRVGPPFGIDGIAPSPEGQGRKSRCPDVATRGRARRRTSKRTEAVDSHLRARSSVGQSRGLIIPWSQVRVLPGPRGESLSQRGSCSVGNGASGSYGHLVRLLSVWSGVSTPSWSRFRRDWGGSRRGGSGGGWNAKPSSTADPPKTTTPRRLGSSTRSGARGSPASVWNPEALSPACSTAGSVVSVSTRGWRRRW